MALVLVLGSVEAAQPPNKRTPTTTTASINPFITYIGIIALSVNARVNEVGLGR